MGCAPSSSICNSAACGFASGSGRGEKAMPTARKPARPVERLTVLAYTVPTETPESDGTYAWDSTTLVLVEAEGGGQRGLGYSYADTATARLIADHLRDVILGR